MRRNVGFGEENNPSEPPPKKSLTAPVFLALAGLALVGLGLLVLPSGALMTFVACVISGVALFVSGAGRLIKRALGMPE